MNWTHHLETPQCNESYHSDQGRVEKIGPGWWDAWAYLPVIEFVEQTQRDMRSSTSKTVKVGECYKTAATAKAAVQRRYKNHCGV